MDIDVDIDPDIAKLIDARAILDSVARTAAASRLDEPPTSIYGRMPYGRMPYRLSLHGLGIGAGIYRPIIEEEARRAGLPAEIAEAVMGVESSYNPATLGAAGEIGLMQVLPSTARMMGFSGPIEALAVPETNIHYGVRYLAQAWRLAGGDLCTAVMKYRAGHGERRFSHRSVAYCLNVRARLAARGFAVYGAVPVATFGEPVGGGCRSCTSVPGGRRADLADLNARLSVSVSRMVTPRSADR
nr:transglycosylase SLT domain-containing protein [Rhodoplanes sp.]